MAKRTLPACSSRFLPLSGVKHAKNTRLASVDLLRTNVPERFLRQLVN